MLWHIKIRYLPNAVSQSPRIQLTLNSVIRTPVSLAEKHSKAKTGKLSPEFGFAEFFSFCTRLLVKQEFPATKALVGMTGFGTLKALSYQKPQAKAAESRFGTQKALPYLNPQAKAYEFSLR